MGEVWEGLPDVDVLGLAEVFDTAELGEEFVIGEACFGFLIEREVSLFEVFEARLELGDV